MDNALKEIMTALAEIQGVEEVLPAGSRFTCDPPVMGTDIDFALLVHDFGPVALLKAVGYATPDVLGNGKDYDEENPQHFMTMRKGSINLIIMTKPRFRLFEAATIISKHLNLLEKEDRVFVFSTLRNKLLAR